MQASPSTSSSSSLPSVGEIIRASKVRFCDDMLHYVFDRQTQRTASSPTSPTPVRHKVQHAEGSIVRQPMPKEVLIAPGDEVLTVAAKKQTVANEPIEVEDDDVRIIHLFYHINVLTRSYGSYCATTTQLPGSGATKESSSIRPPYRSTQTPILIQRYLWLHNLWYYILT